MIFLQLFYTFFKIGLFGFGGGYAMLSMISLMAGFPLKIDIVAISQMTPVVRYQFGNLCRFYSQRRHGDSLSPLLP